MRCIRLWNGGVALLIAGVCGLFAGGEAMTQDEGSDGGATTSDDGATTSDCGSAIAEADAAVADALDGLDAANATGDPGAISAAQDAVAGAVDGLAAAIDAAPALSAADVANCTAVVGGPDPSQGQSVLDQGLSAWVNDIATAIIGLGFDALFDAPFGVSAVLGEMAFPDDAE